MAPGRALTVVAVLSVLAIVPAAAQPATDVSGFGNGGWRSFGGLEVRDIAVRADGSFVVDTAGCGIIGLLPDGRLDRRFGANGVVTEARHMYGDAARGRSLAFQADGKLLVAAGASIARLTRAGRLDPSFGTRGLVSLPTSSSGLAVAPDGDVVVALVEGETASLARYLPDGAPDTDFGVAGHAAVAPRVRPPIHVAVQADGKIVVAGREGVGGVLTNTSPLSRYRVDGSVDTNFADGGLAHADGVPGDALAIQADGKIVVAGLRIVQGVGPETNLLRLLPDGRRDMSFGIDGQISRRFDGLAGVPRALAPLPDGAVAVAGRLYVTGCCKGVYWLAARVAPDGTWTYGDAPDLIDPEHDCWGEYADALAVQPGGHVLVGGSVCTGSLVGRYTPKFELDTGLPLTAGVERQRLTIATSGSTTRISTTLRVSDAARVRVSIRRSGVGEVPLLPGSKLGSARVTRARAAIVGAFGRASRIPLRLVIPRVSARGSVRYVIRVDAADDRDRSDHPRIRVVVPSAP